MKKYKVSGKQLTLEGFETELAKYAAGSHGVSKANVQSDVKDDVESEAEAGAKAGAGAEAYAETGTGAKAEAQAESLSQSPENGKGFEPDTSFLNEYYDSATEADLSDHPDVSLPWPKLSGGKVGRNDPCPCGSGKKYKKCCGANNGKRTPVSRYEDTDEESDAPPTLAQWDRLYQAARLIRSIEPWKYLWSSDLITIVSAAGAEPVYCAVTGMDDYEIAVKVYPGYDAVNTYFRLYNAESGVYEYIEEMGQKCLVCYFADREELKAKEREVIKSLGIRFWGRDEWIYFRALDPGLYPWFISGKQADFLARTLLSVACACRYYIDKTPMKDLDESETILRFYSPEKGLWLNTITNLGPVRFDMTKTTVHDELLVTKLRKCPRNGMELELDVIWFPRAFRINRKHRPSYPRLIFIMDRAEEKNIARRVVAKGESLAHSMMDFLINYIEDEGKPASIHVRDERVSNIIGDLCSKTGIRVFEEEDMFATDTYLKDLFGFVDDDEDDDDDDYYDYDDEDDDDEDDDEDDEE